MCDDIELKKLALEEKKLQLEQQKFDHEKTIGRFTRFSGQISVFVALLATFLSAVSVGITAVNNRSINAEAIEKFEFDGLKMIVNDDSHQLLSCDIKETNLKLGILSDQFEHLKPMLLLAVTNEADYCAQSVYDNTLKNELKEEMSVGSATNDAQTAKVQTASSYLAGVYDILGGYPTSAATENNSVPTASTNTASVNAPATTVYIQYTDAYKAQASALQTALMSDGYNAPGIQRVDARAAPNTPLLKIYYPDQKNLAQTISLLVAPFLSPLQKVDISVPLSEDKGSKRLPTGILEFWFPNK